MSASLSIDSWGFDAIINVVHTIRDLFFSPSFALIISPKRDFVKQFRAILYTSTNFGIWIEILFLIPTIYRCCTSSVQQICATFLEDL